MTLSECEIDVDGHDRGVDHFRHAASARAHVEQAKGILMERHRVDEAEAASMMDQWSIDSHTSMSDVAAEVIYESHGEGSDEWR